MLNYEEELVEYSSNFMEKLEKSFYISDTITYVNVENHKVQTQFGYEIIENLIHHHGEGLKLEEFPFKWGFNGDQVLNDFNSFNSPSRCEYYVPNEMVMHDIVVETIRDQDRFFDAIIAKLLLQDYIGIMKIDLENTFKNIVRLQPTKENSSKFGSLDYIEYIFHLAVFKEEN